MRPLTLALDEISLGNTAKRQPAWQVLLYDVRSGENTVADVVTGATLATQTGPLDITPILKSLKIEENGGDYIADGVASSIIQGECIDADGLYDPDLVISDSDALGRFFRKGNVVRVLEGDERVAAADWPMTFTGRLAGQAGYRRGRAPLRASLTFKAYSREATFVPFERTSVQFLYGTTYLAMAEAVASGEMGLETGEMNLFGFGTKVLQHEFSTLAQLNPMAMLAKIMFVDGFLPVFDGAGVLTQTSGLVTDDSDRFYAHTDHIASIDRPLSEVQPPDAVCVVGLEYFTRRVDQPRQTIAKMSVTTGYFTNGEDLTVYWTDDKTQLADNVEPQMLKSVNGGMGLGGGENFFPIPSPSAQQVGTIGYRVTISTGFAPWVAIFLMATYVGLAALPDYVQGEGVGIGVVVVFGFTISWGRILQAIALAAALLVMTRLGRGEYRFWGEPFEFVFKKIPECAAVEGSSEFDRKEVEVENHLIDNRPDGKWIAGQLLFRQAARGRPRNIEMLHDLALQPDDTMELLTDNRRFLISSIERTLERGATKIAANLKAFEITTNIARAT